MNLKAAPRGKVFPTEHAGEGLARVGVPVQDVHLQVALLARRDVRAVWAVPASERLHHNHVCKSVLQHETFEEPQNEFFTPTNVLHFLHSIKTYTRHSMPIQKD